MNSYICSSLILILCFTATLAAVAGDKEHNLHPKKRNFVKDLEPKEKDEMSKFALNTLNSLDPTYSKRILCQVLEGQKQFDSGIIYRLKLSVVVIPEEDYNLSATSQSCNENQDKVVCEIDVLRSYAATDYSPINAQVIKSECSDASHDHPVEKRDVLVGGKTSLDVNSEEVKEYANLVLTKVNTDAGPNGCKQRVNGVQRATTQVVSGRLIELAIEFCPDSCSDTTNDKCKICTAKIWEQPWLKSESRKVTVSCGNDDNNSLKNPLEVDRSQFHEFTQKYNKFYKNEEEKERRFRIFRGNLKKIQLLNDNEEGTAEYGVNEFADLSKSEFKKHYLGLKPSGNEIKNKAIIPNVRLPSDFDWRNYNAVTPVKNQGMCGSCWAFSVTGNVEGQWAIKHKQLVSLSEQELVDCDKYDNGCMGGYMTEAYKAIEDLGGLENESDYPYEGSNDKCIFSKAKAVVKVVDSVNITSNETEMAQWLFKNGPISIALNAFAMQFYIRGISKPWKFLCNPNDLDHGVLIVGYGVYSKSNKELPYWTIKNSWGSYWGESGYYRLYRGSGACGVNKMASSGIVA